MRSTCRRILVYWRAARHIILTCIAAAIILASPEAQAQWCGEWQKVADSGPAARQFHAMAFDSARGVTVLFGGATPDGQFGDTWEWDGVKWTKVADKGPGLRGNCAMAYDDARGVTVLFGGWDGGKTLGDTWEWDGQTWRKVANSGPAARLGHAMAYDSSRGVTVLFGGWNETQQNLRDTWEWNGTEWRHASDNGPSRRGPSGLAFDRRKGVTTLFGGFNHGTTYGDTWEWNGLEWSFRSDDGPDDRSHTALAYDSTNAVSVLFGGWDGGSVLFDDTWAWDGLEWAQVVTSIHPELRRTHAMSFDTYRGVFVLFGGGGGPLYSDTWELKLSPGAEIVEQPQDVIIGAGNPVEFSVIVDSPGDVSYQWRRDGIPLEDGGSVSGSKTDTLTISKVFRPDAGDYDCVISSDCGDLLSDPANLFVVDPVLAVDASCPTGGPIRVDWEFGTPDGQVAILYAKEIGGFRIPRYLRCAGTRIAIGPLGAQVVWMGRSNADGSQVLNASAGPAACGKFLQLIDLGACETSNVVTIE